MEERGVAVYVIDGETERLSNGFETGTGDSVDLVAHATDLLFGRREATGPQDVVD
jgi:hypothetical protein